MNNCDWKKCIKTCRRFLGKGSWDPFLSDSWCAFTTFSSLRKGIHYWACGLPDESECLDIQTADGGLWRQSFKYNDLAHLIIPVEFYWEKIDQHGFKCGKKHQNITALSSELDRLGIVHRLTDIVLEIKLY
jgi:hypothetical protein